MWLKKFNYVYFHKSQKNIIVLCKIGFSTNKQFCFSIWFNIQLQWGKLCSSLDWNIFYLTYSEGNFVQVRIGIYFKSWVWSTQNKDSIAEYFFRLFQDGWGNKHFRPCHDQRNERILEYICITFPFLIESACQRQVQTLNIVCINNLWVNSVFSHRDVRTHYSHW